MLHLKCNLCYYDYKGDISRMHEENDILSPFREFLDSRSSAIYGFIIDT